MEPRKKTRKRCHSHDHLMGSRISLPQETVEPYLDDMEFIREYSDHSKLVISGGSGSRVNRSITCRGENKDEIRTLIIEDKTGISSKMKHCSDFMLYEKSTPSTSSTFMMKLQIVSNLVLWIRDGRNRYLGSVRLEPDTQDLTILDPTGRPSVIIDTKDPRKKNSADSALSDDSCSHLLTYRCAKSGLALATCRIFRSELKPKANHSARVITLDFRSKDILDLVDPLGTKRRLCLASLVFLEAAMKMLKGGKAHHGSVWYV